MPKAQTSWPWGWAGPGQVTHGFHLFEGKMDHPMEDYIVATNRKVSGHHLGYMRFLAVHKLMYVANATRSNDVAMTY